MRFDPIEFTAPHDFVVTGEERGGNVVDIVFKKGEHVNFVQHLDSQWGGKESGYFKGKDTGPIVKEACVPALVTRLRALANPPPPPPQKSRFELLADELEADDNPQATAS